MLWRTVGYGKLTLALFLQSCYTLLLFGPIISLYMLIEHLDGTNTLDTWTVWVLVSLMLICPCMGAICTAHARATMARIGLDFRNMVVCAIYQKVLVLSLSSRQGTGEGMTSSGQIINMFSEVSVLVPSFDLLALCLSLFLLLLLSLN